MPPGRRAEPANTLEFPTPQFPTPPRAVTVRWRRLRILAAAAVLFGVGLVAPLAPASPARADVPTAGQDLLRTGWDQSEPNLAPSTVVGGNFGQLFATH